MMLKTPAFWYRNTADAPPLMETVLTPLSAAYLMGHRFKQRGFKAEKVDVPVLCIGNINAGGAGKTPSAIALMKLLKTLKIFQKPVFLTRGYGGDEALVLNQVAPTIIAPDRAKGAREAIELNADAIIMDDGFQNQSLHKDLQFVVIDGAMGFGNGKLLPAGPLREPVQDGIGRADAFILIGEDARNIRKQLPENKPVFQANLKPDEKHPISKDKPYFAFAGIGYPDKFFKFLTETMQLNIVETKSFADHHPYDIDEMRDLIKQAEAKGAKLLTTEKDFWRVPEIAQGQVTAVKTYLEWADETKLAEFISAHLSL